jgi:hypothetical protein
VLLAEVVDLCVECGNDRTEKWLETRAEAKISSVSALTVSFDIAPLQSQHSAALHIGFNLYLNDGILI